MPLSLEEEKSNLLPFRVVVKISGEGYSVQCTMGAEVAVGNTGL